MTFYVKDTLENVKRQIAEHRKAEAKQNTQTIIERRIYILDENNPLNATFPWLCAAFVIKLVGGETDSVIPPGILNVVYLYKLMEHLTIGKGFRTFLGVMRRNDLWCNIRAYGFGELKNTSYMAHKEARILAMTSGNRFFDTLITCFKTLAGFYIVTGHVKSTPLHNFIKIQELFNDEELRFYAEELVCAVEFLHSKGIIHRHLTAANIKLTFEGHIKVFNLENAYIAVDEDGRRQERPKAEGTVGIDAYMPPEMIDLMQYGYEVDWWGLGVVLYFMMNGRMPFTGTTKRDLHKSIKFSAPKFDAGLHSNLTQDLVKSFLEKKPKKRLGYNGSNQVLEHEYFQGTDWHKVSNGQSIPPFLPATSPVTSLPSGMCLSLEHLMGSEPVQKSVSRRDLERLQSINIAPDQFIERELDHDWTVYLHPDEPLENAVHYMHGELRPPRLDDQCFNLEECITQLPALSAQERHKFRQYVVDAVMQYEPLKRRDVDGEKFRLLTSKEAEEYDRDPENFCADLWNETSDEDASSRKVSNSGSSLDLSSEFSMPPSEKSAKSSFGQFLKPSNREDGGSTGSLKPGLGRKIKDTFKDKVKFWKGGKDKAKHQLGSASSRSIGPASRRDRGEELSHTNRDDPE